MTRVAVLVRIRRMGWYAADEADRPSSAASNRETSKVFLVQLVGWLAVAAYSAAIGVWLGLGVAINGEHGRHESSGTAPRKPVAFWGGSVTVDGMTSQAAPLLGGFCLPGGRVVVR